MSADDRLLGTEEITRQLAHLRLGQVDMVSQLERINGTLRDVVVEIGGVPGLGRDPQRLSVRRRLHELEDGKHAAEIAAVTLTAARQMRDSAAENRFTRREKLMALALAAVVASGPYLAPILTHF